MEDKTKGKRKWADCVYLGIKKAFDKVPHKRLLRKIEIIGGILGSLSIKEEYREIYFTG